MQLASCIVCLTKENQVPKASVTPPEVAILRKMHMQNYGGDPVQNIKIHLPGPKNKHLDDAGHWKNYNPHIEAARLRNQYGTVPKTQISYFDTLYPNAQGNPNLLPQTFDEVAFIPAAEAAKHNSPATMILPGAPGYDEKEEVKFEPPVVQEPESLEPA